MHRDSTSFAIQFMKPNRREGNGRPTSDPELTYPGCFADAPALFDIKRGVRTQSDVKQEVEHCQFPEARHGVPINRNSPYYLQSAYHMDIVKLLPYILSTRCSYVRGLSPATSCPDHSVGVFFRTPLARLVPRVVYAY